MAIIYPDNLPDFKIGKTREQGQKYVTTSPFSGPMRVRKLTDESPVTWDVSITCTKVQAIIFRRWLKQVSNGETFTKSIWTESGYADHEVRFIELAQNPNQIGTSIFEYSGAIYARALIDPYADISDDLIFDWLDSASIIDYAINDNWG